MPVSGSEPLTSAGTSSTRTDTVPVPHVFGSTSTVYVSEAGRVVESISPPAVETVDDPSTVVPSARRILTEPAIVDAVSCTRAP